MGKHLCFVSRIIDLKNKKKVYVVFPYLWPGPLNGRQECLSHARKHAYAAVTERLCHASRFPHVLLLQSAAQNYWHLGVQLHPLCL